MQAPKHRSIQHNITLVILLISSVVLVLSCIALFMFQAWSIQRNFRDQLSVTAEIVASDIAAALMFNDEERAAQMLAGLKAMPQIVYACLKLNDGTRLAQFGVEGKEKKFDAATVESEFRIDGDHVIFSQPVVHDGSRRGTLYLDADFGALYSELLKLYAGILAAVLAASLLLAYLLSRRFHRFVTGPILSLTETAHRIADAKDYSVRAESVGNDEVGVLTGAFNQMLAQIQAQDATLQSVQSELREKLNSLRREVANRMRAEAIQARLTAIIDGTPDFVGSSDSLGRMHYLNPAARQMIGLQKDTDISSMKLSDLHPGWAARIVSTEGIPGAIHAGSWAGETAIRHRDGNEIDVSQVIIAHKNPTGGLEYLSTVMRDISERKIAEEALKLSQQKLLETSRMAGMAEVATGVLHNVGNVLNSVNVSAGVVLEKLRRSKTSKVSKAAELLTGRNGDLAEYITRDPSGQKLPGYLAKLGAFLNSENIDLLAEMEQLSHNIEHIKEVVSMQQSYAKVSGVFEDLHLDRLVDDAIAMNAGACERHGIMLERCFSDAPPVRVDRHRVLQILINLIRNSKYALDDAKRPDKQLTISIEPFGGANVRVRVTDNGIGISPENLTRIFGHGFTTRKDGHGFGLHSGANAAKEMGGSLSVHSEGLGRGATFTLDLPVAPTASNL